MIAVVDYGVGNLRSVYKAFEKCGFEATVTSDEKIINESKAIVLPGVGAFAQAMTELKKSGLDIVIKDNIKKDKPFLGICLGMQLLLTESEEFGHQEGLNIIPGKVKKFDLDLKIPHMGWNTIKFDDSCPLLADVSKDAYMYFVHSYYVAPDNPEHIVTETEYGIKFTSMVWNRKNAFACQFHPEKSQDEGLKIIKAFGELAEKNG